MTIDKVIPVDYNDEQHRYSLEGKTYLSATQLVDKFKNPFDAKAVAEGYARKHGMTPEYWIQKWNEKRDKACERGSAIHDANQIALEGRMVDRWQGITHKVHSDFVQDRDPWINRPDGVYMERMIWHHGYGIAGRMDKAIIITDHFHGHRIMNIDDYKSNQELEKVSYQFKQSGNYKMMKPPLGHIMDCNWWHYQLQLSIYMFMAEYQGFRPGNMTITHYPHPTEETPYPKPQVHEVTYLKREVLRMLEFLKR